MIRKGLTWENVATQEWLERSNLTECAALPWDNIALLSKWVQSNVYGKLMERSIKPLQDKARSSLTCCWEVSTDCSLSFLHLSSPSSPHSPLFRKEAQCFPTVFGMKDNSIKWVFPSAKQRKCRTADTSFNGRLLSLTVLLSVPRGTASGSKTPHHHCKSNNCQQTCWLWNTGTALVLPPLQRLIRGWSNFEHLPKRP